MSANLLSSLYIILKVSIIVDFPAFVSPKKEIHKFSQSAISSNSSISFLKVAFILSNFVFIPCKNSDSSFLSDTKSFSFNEDVITFFTS